MIKKEQALIEKPDVKKSKDVETAKTNLMKKFKLSEIQAKAILDMRLQRLTGLERQKIEDEYKETIKLIEKLKGILKSEEKRNLIITEEIKDVKKEFADERRTEIVYDYEDFSLEDIIAEEDVVSVEMPNRPGALQKVAEKIADAGIDIIYMYGTAGTGKSPVCVFKTVDDKKAIKVINK